MLTSFKIYSFLVSSSSCLEPSSLVESYSSLYEMENDANMSSSSSE